MIKAIITDIDGVLVGTKKGFNFPEPNSKVLAALKSICAKEIPIVLCTGKFVHALEPIAVRAHLDNPHISDGGSLISDPLTKTIIAEHTLSHTLAKDVSAFAIENNIYEELHCADAYYVQKSQEGSFTQQHTEILQEGPHIIEDMVLEVENLEVIQIILITKDNSQKEIVEKFFQNQQGNYSIVWSHHPTMLPAEFALITAPNVSKKHASEEVLESLGVSFQETLGIGDSLGDWKFMEECGYVGVTGNHSEELKELAKGKGEGKYFLAKSVDEEGVLDIFEYFKLI